MQHTDKHIIQRIRQGGSSRDEMALYLLKEWQGYAFKLSEKYHLSPAQRKDAYTDAIVKLISQIDQGQFKGESKLSTYFFSILNNICVDVLRNASSNKNKATEEVFEWTAIEQRAMQTIIEKDVHENIRYVIDKMGDNCRSVLMDWGYHGYNMKEIAERHQLASAESARSIKYKCLKKLKSMLGIDKKSKS